MNLKTQDIFMTEEHRLLLLEAMRVKRQNLLARQQQLDREMRELDWQVSEIVFQQKVLEFGGRDYSNYGFKRHEGVMAKANGAEG